MPDSLSPPLQTVSNHLQAHDHDVETDLGDETKYDISTSLGTHFVGFGELEYSGVNCVEASYPCHIAAPLGESFQESMREEWIERFEPEEWGLEEEEYESLLENSPVTVAGLQALSSVPQDEMDDFVYRLRKDITSDNTSYQFDVENGCLYNFAVKKRIYTDEATAKDTMETLQTVISRGHLGKKYVEKVLPIGEEIEKPTDIIRDQSLL